LSFNHSCRWSEEVKTTQKKVCSKENCSSHTIKRIS
jgi:hypothetical protein